LAAAGLLLCLAAGTASANRLTAYHDVISLWQDALDSQPDNVATMYHLGLALLGMGRDEEARDLLTRVNAEAGGGELGTKAAWALGLQLVRHEDEAEPLGEHRLASGADKERRVRELFDLDLERITAVTGPAEEGDR
jgi:thioredoxin-like negative regulator of GroEL